MWQRSATDHHPCAEPSPFRPPPALARHQFPTRPPHRHLPAFPASFLQPGRAAEPAPWAQPFGTGRWHVPRPLAQPEPLRGVLGGGRFWWHPRGGLVPELWRAVPAGWVWVADAGLGTARAGGTTGGCKQKAPRFPASWEKIILGTKIVLGTNYPPEVTGKGSGGVPLGPGRALLRGQAAPRSRAAVPLGGRSTGAEPDPVVLVFPDGIFSGALSTSAQAAAALMPGRHKGSSAPLEHPLGLRREGAPQSASGGGREPAVGCPDVGESRGAAAGRGDERHSDVSLHPFYLPLIFRQIFHFISLSDFSGRAAGPTRPRSCPCSHATAAAWPITPQPSPPALIHQCLLLQE